MKRFVSVILATSLVLLAYAGEHEPVEPGSTPLPAADQAMVRDLGLAFVHQDGAEVLATVGFGDVNGFNRIRPEEGTLEVRAAGSDVTVVDVTAYDGA